MLRDSLSPEVGLTSLKIHQGQVTVVRDDLLPGGTKQRACAPFLREMNALGYSEFIYASPFSGFAQVALAHVCQALQMKCTLVCESDPSQAPGQLHAFSKLAQSFGAEIITASQLSEAEEKAQELALMRSGSLKIPLGFDCPEFRSHLKIKLGEQWESILKRCPQIKDVWLPLGSGTLARTFHDILPEDISINCVNVHVLKPEDFRIRNLEKYKRIRLYEAPMPFHERARFLPQIPSNIFYDAKLWEFIHYHGKDKDLWWNVAQ